MKTMLFHLNNALHLNRSASTQTLSSAAVAGSFNLNTNSKTKAQAPSLSKSDRSLLDNCWRSFDAERGL